MCTFYWDIIIEGQQKQFSETCSTIIKQQPEDIKLPELFHYIRTQSNTLIVLKSKKLALIKVAICVVFFSSNYLRFPRNYFQLAPVEILER